MQSRYLDDPKALEKTKLAAEDLLGEDLSRQIRVAYELDNADPYPGMLKLISELRFYLPVLAAAKGLRFPEGVQVKEYHMHQVSSSTRNRTYHCIS